MLCYTHIHETCFYKKLSLLGRTYILTEKNDWVIGFRWCETIGEQRVGRSLSRVNPSYHVSQQTATARQMNPVPYRADYFGHKLHIDQNEKCVMYGVTHVCAVDGYSGKIGFITMPAKKQC